MGRSPCCDKLGLKKGPWTPEEDHKLLAYIEEHGHGSWRALPTKAGLQRCGKSCRLRWTNYLRPDIKRGKFSLQEEQTIIQLHALLGNRWSTIATHLPKRTDNEIKNYWNTHLKKRLTKMGIDPVTHKPKNDSIMSNNEGNSKNNANLSHIAQWESARLEAEARLVKQSKLHSSSEIWSHDFPRRPPFVSATKMAPPQPTNLDILKTWNGSWSTKKISTSGTDHQLESPKSTVSYSAAANIGESSTTFIELMRNSSGSCEDAIMREEGEEEWSGLKNIINPMENAWSSETLRLGYDNVGQVTTTAYLKNKFSDLLVNNCNSGDWSFSQGDGDQSDTGGVATDEYCENSNSYWNSVLNLVNSESPVL